jgi:hypothetical protein
MPRFAKSHYNIKNKEKYVGTKVPYARSSWEFVFMKTLDEHPGVLHWASENIKIPYKDPFTGKQTVYVPDFFVVYVDKDKKKHAELIEVKPESQSLRESTGKSQVNQQQYVKNLAKWAAASAWCKQKGITFRVVTEKDIFHQGSKRR